MKLKVVKPFLDKNDHKTKYAPGAVLTMDDAERIEDLLDRGLCVVVSIKSDEKPEEPVAYKGKEYPLADIKTALAALDIPVAANAKARGVTRALEQLTEEQTAALEKVLTKEEE